MSTMPARTKRLHNRKKFVAMSEAISDIVSSRDVSKFRVGITGSLSHRRRSYGGWTKKAFGVPLRGFAVLDWEHTPDTALAIEKELFEQFRSHKKYALPTEAHLAHVNRSKDIQYIYVAWW